MSETLKLGQRVRHQSETGPDMVVTDFAIDSSNPRNMVDQIKDVNRPICRYFHELTQDWRLQEFLAFELMVIED